LVVEEKVRKYSRLSTAVLLGLVSFWLAFVTCVRPAHAEDEKRASEFNLKAIEAYKAKRFLVAIDFWLQATEVASEKQLISLHKNLGLALFKLERFPEAWYHLTTYMQRAAGTDAKVAKKIVACEKKLKKMHVRVRINSQPPSSAILPPGDRMHRIRTPFSWWLPPGEYVVEFTRDGYLTSKEKVRVELEGKKSFSFALKRKPTTGLLVLTGKAEGSNVRLNGKAQGPLPFKVDLKPGVYKLEVFYATGEKWMGEARMEAGKTVEMEVQLGTVVQPPVVKRERKSQLWKWLTLGAGAALLATGGAFTAMAIKGLEDYDKINKKYSHITSTTHPDYLDSYIPEYDAVWTDEIQPNLTASYVFYGVGGAAVLVGAGALIFLNGSDDEVSSSLFRFMPMMGPQRAGLGLEWQF